MVNTSGNVGIVNPETDEFSHNFVEPQAVGEVQVVGAPSKDVWVFDSKTPGAATISMSYSRPWEGGEKELWTYTMTVTVE